MGGRRCRRRRGSPPQSARQRGVKAKEGPSRSRSGVEQSRFGSAAVTDGAGGANAAFAATWWTGKRPNPARWRGSRFASPASHPSRSPRRVPPRHRADLSAGACAIEGAMFLAVRDRRCGATGWLRVGVEGTDDSTGRLSSPCPSADRGSGRGRIAGRPAGRVAAGWRPISRYGRGGWSVAVDGRSRPGHGVGRGYCARRSGRQRASRNAAVCGARCSGRVARRHGVPARGRGAVLQ